MMINPSLRWHAHEYRLLLADSVIFVLGMLLIGAGFSLRKNGGGLLLLWLGTLCMLGLIFFHILRVVSL